MSLGLLHGAARLEHFRQSPDPDRLQHLADFDDLTPVLAALPR